MYEGQYRRNVAMAIEQTTVVTEYQMIYVNTCVFPRQTGYG
jgi:hypothetical protein